MKPNALRTFYLQYGIRDNSEGWTTPGYFIDERLHPECDLFDSHPFADWLAARRAFVRAHPHIGFAR
jgi:hypothetical protein